jgi:hypothetical protein
LQELDYNFVDTYCESLWTRFLPMYHYRHRLTLTEYAITPKLIICYSDELVLVVVNEWTRNFECRIYLKDVGIEYIHTPLSDLLMCVCVCVESIFGLIK